MLVVADGLQVSGKSFGEGRGFHNSIVLTAFEICGEGLAELFGDFRKDVVLLQNSRDTLDRAFSHFVAKWRLAGEEFFRVDGALDYDAIQGVRRVLLELESHFIPFAVALVLHKNGQLAG